MKGGEGPDGQGALQPVKGLKRSVATGIVLVECLVLQRSGSLHTPLQHDTPAPTLSASCQTHHHLLVLLVHLSDISHERACQSRDTRGWKRRDAVAPFLMRLPMPATSTLMMGNTDAIDKIPNVS